MPGNLAIDRIAANQNLTLNAFGVVSVVGESFSMELPWVAGAV